MYKDAAYLFGARPDINGVYLLSVDSVGYQLGWADASGVTLSPITEWDSGNLDSLIAYTHSLCVPPKDHIFFDTTLKAFLKPSDKSKVRWSIHSGDLLAYTDCEYLFHGGAFGRRTSVFGSTKEDDNFVIIKDSFQDVSRSISESKVLGRIHEDGIVPGVVALVHSEQVPANPDSTDPEPLSVSSHRQDSSSRRCRTKHRLVMGSRGVPLSEAKSVKDILMTTYDVLAVHRWLGKRRRIIHRDIAKNNVLMYPKHRKNIKIRRVVSDPPQFIQNILKGVTSPTNLDDASCLLIDFDIASPLPDTAGDGLVNEELTRRVGTPMYMSRSVNIERQLNSRQSVRFVPMPELTGVARDLYIKIYQQNIYDSYTDSNGTIHGGVYIRGSECERHPFVHRLDHDAESTFWLLLSTLLRAQTPNSTDDPDALRVLDQYWETISDPVSGGVYDPRNSVLDLTEQDFSTLLHPDLRSLAPLIRALADQVQVEYVFLDPPPPEDHLHEALSRILLQFIVDMKEDIPLDPNNLRPVNPIRLYESIKSYSSTVYESDSDSDVSESDSETEPETDRTTSIDESEPKTPENTKEISIIKDTPLRGTKRKSETDDGEDFWCKRLRTWKDWVVSAIAY
ncbi:hypothetical protein C8Q75DRAFT_719219 [Abortiporus biennis]|nr:hypothetical protein C8Q75DRAFT_719219 [Abortiporus biennis]